jgi:hypothetical protein
MENSGGTHYGGYRQCAILPYTNDIDFAAPITDYTPAIMAATNWVLRMGLVGGALAFNPGLN